MADVQMELPSLAKTTGYKKFSIMGKDYLAFVTRVLKFLLKFPYGVNHPFVAFAIDTTENETFRTRV
jgi:hypothetical protein